MCLTSAAVLASPLSRHGPLSSQALVNPILPQSSPITGTTLGVTVVGMVAASLFLGPLAGPSYLRLSHRLKPAGIKELRSFEVYTPACSGALEAPEVQVLEQLLLEARHASQDALSARTTRLAARRRVEVDDLLNALELVE